MMNTAPKMLTRESVFVLRLKICAMTTLRPRFDWHAGFRAVGASYKPERPRSARAPACSLRTDRPYSSDLGSLRWSRGRNAVVLDAHFEGHI